MINYRPKDYTLISMTDEGYGVWRPNINDNYGLISDIISKKKPSLNRIKMVPKKFLNNSTISDIKFNYKGSKVDGFNVWNIYNSDYYYINDSTNNEHK